MIGRAWLSYLKQVGAVEGGTGSWAAATSVTIAGGILALSGPGRYLVDTQDGDPSDDVDTITGLVDGDEVLLAPASGARTVVLINSTVGDANLDIKTNISMNDANDRVRLLMETSGNLVEASSRP